MINLFKLFYYFIKDLLAKRDLIWNLTKRDLQTRFAGSYFGRIWIFIQPIITIFIFWFVFQQGFKAKPVEDYPFILWLTTGMLPFFFFSDSFIAATGSIVDNSFLVKKVAFRISVLPIVKIISALLVHIFFIGVLFLMFLGYGYYPNLYNFQIIYYLFCLIILLLGLSWITSASLPFFKDINPILQTVLQFMFWGTPIFWSLNIIPAKYTFIFKLNPLFYIIQGYRDTFINKIWFWQHDKLSIYFWILTSFIFVTGGIVFRKLKPHFGDVI